MTQHLFTDLHSVKDKDVLEKLRAAIENRRCILIAGSGLSALAYTEYGERLPQLRDLLKGMVGWCYEKDLIDLQSAIGIDELINGDYLSEAGLEIEETLEDKSTLQRCLKDILLCDEARISNVHRLVIRIPFKAYFSTYYDTLIENAYYEVKKNELPRFDEKLTDGTFEELCPFILKIYGDVSNPNTINLSERSYKTFIDKSNDYQTALRLLTQDSSFLYIGCEKADLHDFLNKSLAFNKQIEHWMVIPEGQLPRLKIKRLEVDKKIHVIQYNPTQSHRELVNFLRELATSPAYVQETPKYEDSALRFKEREPLTITEINERRRQQLAKRISEAQELLSESEKAELYEPDPIQRAKYHADKEKTQNLLNGYLQEYDKL